MKKISRSEILKDWCKKEYSDSYVESNKLSIDHYTMYGWGKNTNDQLRQVNFIQKMRGWLDKDEIAKLRMIDLAYVMNYDDGENKNYYSTYVSNIIKKNIPVSIEDESRIYNLMNHIDNLIAERHVLYVVSSLNTEGVYY